MKKTRTSYLMTLLFLIVGISSSQTLTVRYIEGDETDRWFLLYDQIQTNLNLTNSYINLGDPDEIFVNFYDKVQIEFVVTDDIDSVFIEDPWRWDEDGISVPEFIQLNDWIVEVNYKVFPGRGGIDINDPDPPFYSLKAKRLVATAGTGHDGIYRADSWGGEGIEIHPVEIIDPYDFYMPEHMTEDFYYLSPVIFDDGESIALSISYEKESETLDEEIRIKIFSNETLTISPGANIQFSTGIECSAGTHFVVWDATEVASGVYIYQIKTDNNIKSQKMVLLK